MKPFADKIQVCIIGAGPAGLCAALRLLAMGHSVAIIESEKFPRHQIGESLSPGVRGIFAYLDAEHLLNEESILHHLPSNIIWENRDSNFMHTEKQQGNQVADRSLLDHGLLQLAVSRGLHLMQPATLNKIDRNEEGWELGVCMGENRMLIHAAIVLDARGRKGSLLNERVPVSSPLVALWAHLPAGLMPEETFVEAIPEGWFWGTKVSGNRYRVMAFTDGKTIQQNSTRHLSGMAEKSTFFSAIAGELRSLPVETCSVTSFVHQQPWNRQFIKLGEAAFTLDPLSSSGVEKAMRFSLQAAIAVNTYLRNSGSLYAKDYYEEKLIESVSTHAHWTASFYKQAWPYHEDAAFWKRKSGLRFTLPANASDFLQNLGRELNKVPADKKHTSPVSIPVDLVLNQIRYNRISASPLISFQKMYAVREDCVEEMTAVCHPQLERPVGFLEQLELKLLLQEINGLTIETAIETLSTRVATEKAKKILVHLWQNQLILLN